MKQFINGGIYYVNLHYERNNADKVNEDDFNDNTHPAIIFENIKDKNTVYAIPLTTDSTENWIKWKKESALRIQSTGSIACISRCRIRRKTDIGKRVCNADGSLMKLTSEELDRVYQKYKGLTDTIFEETKKAYIKYIEECEKFEKLCVKHLNENCDGSVFTRREHKDRNEVVYVANKNIVKELSLDDVRDISQKVLGKGYIEVKYINAKMEGKMNKIVIKKIF